MLCVSLVLVAGQLETFCGLNGRGFAMGDRRSASFLHPVSVCRDPTSTSPTGTGTGTCYFMADLVSIRYFDEAKDAVTLICGGADAGSADGVGSAARFRGISSILVTADAKTIWCGDSDGRPRRVDVTTGTGTDTGTGTTGTSDRAAFAADD